MTAAELRRWLSDKENSSYQCFKHQLKGGGIMVPYLKALESLAECRKAISEIRDCLNEGCLTDSEMVTIIGHMVNPDDSTYSWDKCIAGYPREVPDEKD